MTRSTATPFYVLPLIVFAQFAGTSLWFAGNAVVKDLQQTLNLATNVTGDITAAVQFGFIVGTFVFAFLSIADRYAPTKVFLVAVVFGALFNISILWVSGFKALLCCRFVTGFFLAGVYPVGMKIASDWFEKGLGKALGYLVGALVLGTAFPHLLNTFSQSFSWKIILAVTSGVAVFGGVVLSIFVSDGPHRKPGAQFEWNAISRIFAFSKFRSAAFGYFGHMWELYAFWTFTPLIISTYNELNQTDFNVPLISFLTIGIGSLGCIIGGYVSLKKGSSKVAFVLLLISGCCCLLSPFCFNLSPLFFLLFLMVWGFTVVGDSPQFSTLVAQTAPSLYIGTALTIVNCIGFALTIISIQLLSYLMEVWSVTNSFVVLVIGPIIGLLALKR